jgi:competence protein ComFC
MGFFLERVASFFLPPQCYCCGDFLDEGQRGFCPDCLSRVRWIVPPFCTVCGIPFLSPEAENHPCGMCLKKERYFTEARALGHYEGALQEAIRRWKYEGKVHLAPLLGQWMAERFYDHWASSRFDLLLPVPLHLERLRERGFNQALLLVKEISRRTGIPYGKRILRKDRPTSPQAGLSGLKREKEVKGVFSVVAGEEMKDKSILLVDDVYTTGATANECSRVLLVAGAQRVDVLTLARTMMRT